MNQRLQSHLEESDRIQSAFIKTGILMSYYKVLDALHSSRKLRMKELSTKLSVAGPNLNTTIKHLERLGFVERRTGDCDRRAVYAHITDTGRKAFEEAEKIVNQALS